MDYSCDWCHKVIEPPNFVWKITRQLVQPYDPPITEYRHYCSMYHAIEYWQRQVTIMEELEKGEITTSKP